MKRIYNHYYLIVTGCISLVSLVIYFLPNLISTAVTAAICLSLIVTLGIFHGSNDLFALRFIFSDSKSKYGLKVFAYLLCSLIFIVLYFIDARLMLILFVAISAYHFGEERSLVLKGLPSLTRILWSFAHGSCIFLLLFYSNFQEFTHVIIDFGFSGVRPIDIKRALVPCFIAQTIILLGSFFLGHLSGIKVLSVLAELAALFFLFQTLNLLAGFTLYFIFWHSIPSIRTQIALRNKKEKTFSLRNFVAQSSPVYLLSASAAMIALFYFYKGAIGMEVIIIFIACVTIPHVLVMAFFEKN